MADISGRRDRNKKSPGVHYDMHRCTRGCDLHCFVAERVGIGGNATGTGESTSTCGYVRIYVRKCVSVGVHVFRIVSNDGQRGSRGVQRDTAAGISIYIKHVRAKKETELRLSGTLRQGIALSTSAYLTFLHIKPKI